MLIQNWLSLFLLCALALVLGSEAASPPTPPGLPPKRLFPTATSPVKRAKNEQYEAMRQKQLAGELVGYNYPITPNGTYGAIFLTNDSTPGKAGEQWITYPTLYPAKGLAYQYFLGAIYVTFMDDTNINVTQVLWVQGSDGSYGFLPPIQMFGRYVLGGLNTPSTIFISYNGPNSCLEGPLPYSYNVSRYWCCDPSCPMAMEYVENFYQLAVAYEADNSTAFIAIGNAGETFGGVPYDIPLLCLTPPCARLSLAPNAVGALCVDGQCIGGDVWRFLKSLFGKVLSLLYDRR